MKNAKQTRVLQAVSLKTLCSLLVFYAVLSLPAIVAPCRANGASSYESGIHGAFTDVSGREWMLSEVRSVGNAGGNTVTIDRARLAADNMAGAFSLVFNEKQVNGMGVVNRYVAPYTENANNVLSIGNIASTMMLALKEPDGLKENEYFGYLSKVTRWDLKERKLELSSSDSKGAASVLVFIPK